MSRINGASRRLAACCLLAGALAMLPASPAAAGAAGSGSSRIVGGYTPPPSEWPWMTALLHSESATPGQNDFDRQFCGGALVQPAIVLTAAHCVADEVATGVQVLLGRENLLAAGGEKIDVTSIATHPSFSPTTMRNDVAILRLARSSSYQSEPAFDPNLTLNEGDRLVVMGWGLTQEGGSASPSLLAADVPLIADATCQNLYATFTIQYDPSTMLCTGFSDGGVDSCQGDSGGPLMAPDATYGWLPVGVVSFGDGCARPSRPGVYAWLQATSIVDWLVQQGVI
jgi:trypsin